MTKINKKISNRLIEIAELLDLKGGNQGYRKNAYLNVSKILENDDIQIDLLYKENGLRGIESIKGIGESIAKKIEEFITKGEISYLKELREETTIRQVVTHYFKTKGVSLEELKKNARKRTIVYSRYTKPAKELIELAGSIEEAKKAITTVSEWAKSRDLEYTIETVFKKWLELDKLKPKEIIKKPYYNGDPLIWSKTKNKWFVIDKTNTWLEFADTEDKIEWKIIK